MTSFLTTLPHDPLLDLDPWVGQRQCTFRFNLTNRLTGQNLGEITPLRGASLTHDTTKTIKRQLSISLGVADTAAINTVTDLVTVTMVFPNGQEYPLGEYMFTTDSRQLFTVGKLGQTMLNDQMFLVDQQITEGISGVGRSVVDVIVEVLAGLPVTYTLEAATFTSTEAWGIGTNRGQILEALSLSGDYFSPWFDHTGVLRFIRTFDPSNSIPSMNFDVGNKVIRENILEDDDLLTAPNTFIVISNASETPDVAVVGTAEVPSNAPHSVENRGFVIAEVLNLQLSNNLQAQAVAEGLVNRQTIFERVSLTTAPDPRHDSYDVIRWQDDLWLELAWSMSLVEGGQMNHLLRKSYSS